MRFVGLFIYFLSFSVWSTMKVLLKPSSMSNSSIRYTLRLLNPLQGFYCVVLSPHVLMWKVPTTISLQLPYPRRLHFLHPALLQLYNCQIPISSALYVKHLCSNMDKFCTSVLNMLYQISMIRPQCNYPFQVNVWFCYDWSLK